VEKIDAALQKEVNDMINEAQKALREMAYALQSAPQELPEDFGKSRGPQEPRPGKIARPLVLRSTTR